MITGNEIRLLRGLAPPGDTTESLKSKFHALRTARCPFFLEPREFDDILEWKLGDQLPRVERHRKLLMDEAIPVVTAAAFESCAANREETLKLRTGILTALPVVGVPVASAILSLVMPEEYGVIDFRAWRQVFPDKAKSFSIPSYLRTCEKSGV